MSAHLRNLHNYHIFRYLVNVAGVIGLFITIQGLYNNSPRFSYGFNVNSKISFQILSLFILQSMKPKSGLNNDILNIVGTAKSVYS